MRRKATTRTDYRDVRRLVTESGADSAVVAVLDKLFSASMLVAPVVLGPVALPLLGLFDMKNDLILRANDVARGLAGRGGHFLDRGESLAAAHFLITYTAFWSAVDEAVGPVLAGAAPLEWHRGLPGPEIRRDAEAAESGEPYAGLPPVSLPHPAATFGDEQQQRLQLYQQMADRLAKVLKLQRNLASVDGIDAVPELAMRYYYAQYLDLMLASRDFFTWATTYEHAKTQSLVVDAGETVSEQLRAVLAAVGGVDVGLRHLRAALEHAGSPPGRPGRGDTARVTAALGAVYQDRVTAKVIRDDYDAAGRPVLDYAPKAAAFIPQQYRELRYTGQGVNLEDEQRWASVPPRDDVAAFVVRFLASPYSTEAPLLVLGHPGSGKSLFTEVLAARLAEGDAFGVVRVQLRDIDPETTVQSQIEDQICADSGYDVNWAEFAGALADNPLLVILDGYDELLQASGRAFSGYLEQVHKFQLRERLVGRPVRVLVTSRITLIDKAVVPPGTTVVRLAGFDPGRQETWAAQWNALNRPYFDRTGVRPFALPAGPSLRDLARQPLLLLMLAIYDSQSNQLADADLDQTLLYHSLLCRFIERERLKGDDGAAFAALPAPERAALVETDLERLGVAAIGMFNRQSLHISRTDLDGDIAFAGTARPRSPGAGALSPAELLLGSFFFIHESRSRTAGTAGVTGADGVSQGDAAAFEFLHNTFGEFLAADLILRRVLTHTTLVTDLRASERLAAALHEQLSRPDRQWFACLSFAALHTRPLILRMLREWLPHRLAQQGLAAPDFAASLDRIIHRQLDDVLNASPPRWFTEADKPPYPPLPLLGALAVYTLNLVLLAAWLDDFELDDTDRAWERLTHQWRSWFSLHTLTAFATVARARREPSGVVRVVAWDEHPVHRSAADKLLTVSTALADDRTAGLAGVAIARLHGLSADRADEALAALERAGIDTELERAARALRDGRGAGKLSTAVRRTTDALNRSHPGDETDGVPGAAASVLRRLRALGWLGPRFRLASMRLSRLAAMPREDAAAVIETTAAMNPEWLDRLCLDASLSGGNLRMRPLTAPLLRAARVYRSAELPPLIGRVLDDAYPDPGLDLETAIELALAAVTVRMGIDVADRLLADRLGDWLAIDWLPERLWLGLLREAMAPGSPLARSSPALSRSSSEEASPRAFVTRLALRRDEWRPKTLRRNANLGRQRSRGFGPEVVVLLLHAARQWDAAGGLAQVLELGSADQVADLRRLADLPPSGGLDGDLAWFAGELERLEERRFLADYGGE